MGLINAWRHARRPAIRWAWQWISCGSGAEAFLRWLHVIAGIGWIGSSFYFIHLDYSLKRARAAAQGLRRGLAGARRRLLQHGQIPGRAGAHARGADLVQVGGLRHLDLGFALVVAIYYAGASLYLIDPAVLAISPATGIAISSPAWCWAGLSTMGSAVPARPQRERAGGGRLRLLVALAYASTRIFSARGAFMQMGALIGTIMAANVLMVIIPGQRKVVADLIAGRTPDPVHGRRGKQRSTHNNYLTLPVVFVMISGHYPLAYATRCSWVILALLLVMGGVMRHFFNVRHQGLPSPWWTWGPPSRAGC
jgi:uncharacterized membrane protein